MSNQVTDNGLNPYYEGRHSGEPVRCWAMRRALLAALDALPATRAARDVLAERRRQVEVEGWTPEHDDRHDKFELLQAAGCYAFDVDIYLNAGRPPPMWPWEASQWKPKTYRQDLVRAAALLLAEIERIDRAVERAQS